LPSPTTTKPRKRFGTACATIGNEAPITSVLYSPKNSSALPIAARASSALTLMSPLEALSNAICSTKKTKGYLADPALLDRLVTERSASLVADLEGQGWAWAEVHLENDYWEALEKYKTLRPVPVDLDPGLLAEADKLRAELDAIDQASEDEEPSVQAECRRDEIENRLDEIEAGKTEFTSEQKSQAGVIVTIGHNGKPVYHCGLVERGAKGASTSGDDSNSLDQEKEDLSAALLQDLTTQRTAALRAALSVRPDIALIAITHNLAAQVFYDQTYLLPSSLTVRTDAHADGFDLRSAAESKAAKAISEQTKDVRNLLPPKLELLWDWALEQPQNVLLKVLAVGVAHTVNAVQSPHDDASTGRLAAADALARALAFDMANWWQPTAANYFARIKKDQILQAIQEATRAPVKERLRSLKKQDLAAEAEKSVTGTRWLPEPLRK
jgi:ParB family transcriptional regulator, chromosome partitioning protein